MSLYLGVGSILGLIFKHVDPQTTRNEVYLTRSERIEISGGEEAEQLIPKLLVGLILLLKLHGVDSSIGVHIPSVGPLAAFKPLLGFFIGNFCHDINRFETYLEILNVSAIAQSLSDPGEKHQDH